MTSVPFPPSGQYVSSIRSSCRDLRMKAGVEIKSGSIDRLLQSKAFTTSFERVSQSHGLALPLKFPSHLAELNLLSVLSLLNFASGYRLALHQQTKRGAWDNIRALVFSMYITSTTGDEGDLLSARGMKAVHEAKIAELLGVDLHVEVPHPTIPAVTVGQLGGPIYELVKSIARVLNETGDVLLKSGYPDLGSFVLEALKEGNKSKSSGADLDIVLERLVRAIPGFRDMAVIDGTSVYCFKKALFLVHAIQLRFGTLSPPPFPIPDTTNSPVFMDNVLPSMLIHLGVLDLTNASHGLSTLFPEADNEEMLSSLLVEAPSSSVKPDKSNSSPSKDGPSVTEEQAYILRAAAIDACELVIERVATLDQSEAETPVWLNKMTLPSLDMWLWAVAKDRVDYRALDRFAAKNTVYF